MTNPDPLEAANAATLDRLLDELAARKSEEFDKIAAEEEQAAHALCTQAGERLVQMERARRRQHRREIDKMWQLARRELADRNRRRIWQQQQRWVAETVALVRERLQGETVDEQALIHWVERSLLRQRDRAALVLRVNERWAEAAAPLAGRVEVVPILGGAILSHPELNVEIDGSWDLRLEQMQGEIWGRWKEFWQGEHE